MRAPASRVCPLLLLAVLALTESPGRAQLEAVVRLRTGFIPDPAVLEGDVSATRAATELSSHCAGYVGGAPNHVFQFETRFGFLRLFATSDRDLVLAVRAADGSWLCSDDRFGPHPSVEGLFPEGRVEVYVGAATRGATGSYVLRLTETRSVRPGIGSEATWEEGAALARDIGLEIDAAEGGFQNIRLRRGFLPDPRALAGVAGGTIDASLLGGTCRGRIDARPTHVMTLLEPHDFLQLYLDAEAGDRELSLIVLTPDGRFLCDLGTREIPAVEADEWPDGVYRVWVGTLEEDTTQRHQLRISEIRRVR